jgi:PAS domain S-box-containing protein
LRASTDAHDSTEELKAAFDRSKSIVANVLDSLFAFVGVLELDGTLIQANTAPLAAAGLKPDDVVGVKFWDCYWWSYDGEVQEQLRDACTRAAKGETVRYDVPVRMADDTRMIIDFQVAPLRSDTGIVTHLIPSAVDITLRKRQEEELRQRAEEVEKLMDLVPTAVFVSSDPACIDMVGNRMAGELYEADRDENLSAGGSTRRRFFRDGQELPPEALPMQVAAATGRDVGPDELDVLLPSGHWISIWGRATPLRDSKGKVRGALAAFADTTHRKEAERALQEASRRKDEFLAVLAHELRNPLAPLQTGLDLLGSTHSADQGLQRAREMMQRQLAHLVRLVDDLVDVARIGRGDIRLQRAVTDLNEVCATAVDACRSLLDDRRHVFVFEPCSEAAFVEGDFHRLTQVVSNLLSNAAKYTEPGGRISLKIQVEGVHVLISVRDTGRGISEEHLGNVFEMFNRGVDQGRGVGEGLGLGLAISQQLVALHEGSIEARSGGLGRGSEFIIRLPRDVGAKIAKPSETTAPSAVQAQWRVLVVDDNVDAAQSLGTLLELQGHVVEVCYDGSSALNAAVDLDPDVILLDIGLPDLTGHEVARMIRRMPRGQRPVLIAVSGWGRETDKAGAREAGFDHHITKPLRMEVLELLVRETQQKRDLAALD